MRWVRYVLDGIFVCMFLLVFIVGGFALFSKYVHGAGFQIFSVLSGSMEPGIPTGSLIVTIPSREYSVGDVVTHNTSGQSMPVTHRIVEKYEQQGELVFRTKGDANDLEDGGTISIQDIMGKVRLIIPYLGYPVYYSKEPIGFSALILFPAIVIIINEMFVLRKKIAEKRRLQKEKALAISRNMNRKESVSGGLKISHQKAPATNRKNNTPFPVSRKRMIF